MKVSKPAKKMAVFVDEDSGVDIGDYLSDDSSFHGGEALQKEYKLRAACYDPQFHWDTQSFNVQHIAAQSQARVAAHGTKRKRNDDDIDGRGQLTPLTSGDLNKQRSSIASKPTPKITKTGVKLFNPYEGDLFAKQLKESVSTFLSRLPPSTTKLTTVGPWIWVANPFSSYRPSVPDVGTFKQKGMELLESFRRQKRALERAHPGKPPASITRMLKPDRDSLELNIKDLARRTRVTTGKWMLLRPPSLIDETWATVAKHTADGSLGSAAKIETLNVETSPSRPNARLLTPTKLTDQNRSTWRMIHIYTEDFNDLHQIKHVLRQMQKFKLVGGDIDNSGRGNTKTSFSDTTPTGGKVDRAHIVYYKCDAYTHLDIKSGNEFKLKASMYSSAELLAEMSEDQNEIETGTGSETETETENENERGYRKG